MNSHDFRGIVHSIYYANPISRAICEQRWEKLRNRFDYSHYEDISLFTTNCIGGEISNMLHLPFRSPTVNTSFKRYEFVKMMRDPQWYLSSKLRFVERRDPFVPRAVLRGDEDPVYVQFPHENNEADILAKWNRRLKRVNWDRLFVITDDRDGVAQDYLKMIDAIPAERKILLTSHALNYKYAHQLKTYVGQDRVGLYQVRNLLGPYRYEDDFDFVGWILGDFTYLNQFSD